MKAKAEQDIKSRSAVAYALSEAGIAVFPCDPEDKRPLIRGGFKSATNDLDKVKAWWREFPDAIPGITCGSINGISVLDLDRKNGKNGFREMSKRGYDWKTLSAFTQETPSGGAHIYFEYLHGLKSSADKIASGVDVRSDGGYVCFYGSAKDARTLSLFSDTIGLPEFPEELIPEESHEEPRIAPKGYSIEDVKSALATIPNNEGFDSRDDWCSIGFSVHDATNGSREGWKRFLGWSKQHPSFNLEETQSFWRSAGRNPNKITARTLFAVARRYGWSDIGPEDFEDDPEGDAQAMQEFEDRQKAAGKNSQLKLWSPEQCRDNRGNRRYIVKGLIAEGDVSAIIGAPGAGKSLIAPFIGYGVAQGRSVFGRRVRQGGVLYVAAEDAQGMRDRISALYDLHGDARDFAVVEGCGNLLEPASVKALRKIVDDRKPALIFIDTLAMAFAGLEENDSAAMGLVVAAARSLTAKGAAVVLIHHDTKAKDGLPRGHSILNGALDMSLHLIREGETVTGRPTKNRNGTTEIDLSFSIATRCLGYDEDGDEIHAAYADDTEVEPRARKLPPVLATALEHLESLLDASDHQPVAAAVWRQACMAELTESENRKMQQQAFRRASSDLISRKIVAEKNGRFSLRNIRTAISREDFEDDFEY